MNILLVTAMDKEYDIILKAKEKGSISKDRIFLMKTGIGKVNAAGSLSEFLASADHIDRVISVGCAGAAVSSLNVGDIVIGNSYCYHDVYCGEPNENGQVQGLPSVFPSSFMWIKGIENYKLGAIASGDWFVNSREKIESIINFLPKPYNICAIDMESAALAQVCYKKGIEFTSIRIISDNPLLPKQKEQYDNFWDKIAEKVFDELYKILTV